MINNKIQGVCILFLSATCTCLLSLLNFQNFLPWHQSVLPLPVVTNQYDTKFPPSMATDVLTWSNSIEDNEEEDQDNAEVMHPEKLMLKVRNQ